MATATKTARTRQARGMKAEGALDMTRGNGDNRHTYYQPGVVDEALETGVGIIVMDQGVETLTRARRVHRCDLDAVFNEAHERADEGKYINMGALSDDGKTVTGVTNVNPFLASEGNYATTIEALLSFIPKAQLNALTGELKRTRLNGQHIVWNGKATVDDAILVGKWVNGNDLFARAVEINPDIRRLLRSNKSNVQDVREHLGVMAKFLQNIDVLRRARSVFSIATGETNSHRGGATPCAMPLEQCGFAIDKFYLTTGVDANGVETGEYFYRIAIGRGTPWSLRKNEWSGLDVGTEFAYLNDKVLKQSVTAAA